MSDKVTPEYLDDLTPRATERAAQVVQSYYKHVLPDLHGLIRDMKRSVEAGTGCDESLPGWHYKSDTGGAWDGENDSQKMKDAVGKIQQVERDRCLSILRESITETERQGLSQMKLGDIKLIADMMEHIR